MSSEGETLRAVAPTPNRVLGLYDRPMWDGIGARRLVLQSCKDCGHTRYPPAAVCPECLSDDHVWTAPCGKGEILSWVIFHRSYLPAYPAPYNVIAVRLVEGPILVSNLEGEEPNGSWIGQPVELCYATMTDGIVLPRFRLAERAVV